MIKYEDGENLEKDFISNDTSTLEHVLLLSPL